MILLYLAAAAERRLPAWKDVLPGTQNWLPYLVLVGALLGGILAYRLRDRLRPKRKARDLEEEIRRRCAAHGLDDADCRVLTEAMLTEALASPQSALSSEVYFNEFLAAAVERVGSREACERIREKLFSMPRAARDEVVSGTKRLSLGQHVRLSFQNDRGSFGGSVVQVANDSFVVTFEEGRPLDVRRLDRVEGTYESGDALLAFSSEVLAYVKATVHAVRIGHTDLVTLVHRRSTPRMPSNRPILFSHLSQAEAAGGDVAHLADTDGSLLEGVLKDISLGGCAVATEAGTAFAPGDLVVIRVPIRDDLPPLRFSGTIINLSARDRTCLLHCRFMELDERSRHAIALAVGRYFREREAMGQKTVRREPQHPVKDKEKT